MRRVSMYIWTLVTCLICISNILVDVIARNDNSFEISIQSKWVDQTNTIRYGLLVRSKSIVII